VIRRAVRGATVGALPPLAPLQRRPAVHVQICAHADDDLYFMNPDVHLAIRTGDEVVTVYLTAGEADGRNSASEDDDTPVDYAGYSAARMNGIRAAYSYMATGKRSVSWLRETITLPHGARAELATLSSEPRIKLIFLSLSAHPLSTPARRVCHLWTGKITDQTTLEPTGSPMGGPYDYTRAQLVEALVAIYRRFKPTVLRTLDPDPEHTEIRPTGHVEYSDHADHTAAAYFALEALEAYRDQCPDPVAVVSYRGYYNRHWPLNLNSGTHRRKLAPLDIYGGSDPHKCANPAGCGDFKVGGDARSRRYGRSTLSRYPESTSWLRLRGDGRLAAFAVLSGVPVVWTESAPGSGIWDGPTALGISGLAPDLTVLVQPDGRLRLAGIRLHLFPSYNRQRREVVTAVQTSPDGEFEWVGLSNPHYGDWARSHEIGVPALEVNADGRAQLFVRNFGMGVSTRIESPDGTWGRWHDLGGSRVQNAVEAVRTGSGQIELYANTLEGVQRWRQAEPDGAFKIDYDFEAGLPSGRVTAVKSADGRLALFYRAAERETVVAYRQLESEGAWAAAPVDVPGHGGTGSVAGSALPDEAGRPGGYVVAARNRDGAISVTHTLADGTASRWTASGGPALGAPSLATNAQGRLVLAALGPDCRLYLAYQLTGTRAIRFGEWKPAV
jgi:LmbE family N-acetylglucosaminyl deacetylase